MTMYVHDSCTRYNNITSDVTSVSSLDGSIVVEYSPLVLSLSPRIKYSL